MPVELTEKLRGGLAAALLFAVSALCRPLLLPSLHLILEDAQPQLAAVAVPNQVVVGARFLRHGGGLGELQNKKKGSA